MAEKRRFVPGDMRYGSDLIVEVLRSLDIPYIAFNPGATFRGIHDSIVNYSGNVKPEIIECCHEEISVAIAHGYAKAAGKPMAVLVHNVVGLMHASMAIFNAWIDRVPMLVLGGTGPMEITDRRPGIDFIHSALVQGNLVREFVKWDDQPHALSSVAESLLRAYRVAMSEPCGPVYVCYDSSIQEQEISAPLLPPPEQAYVLSTPVTTERENLRLVAEYLTGAGSPVVVTDMAGRNPESFYALVELAELLALPVVEAGKRLKSLNLPSAHPLNLTGASNEVLAEADLVLALEVDDLFGMLHKEEGGVKHSLLRPGTRVIHIGTKELQRNSWVQGYQRYQPADLTVTAETRLALPALLQECRNLLPGPRGEMREERRRALAAKSAVLRAGYQRKAQSAHTQQPIAPSFLALQVWETLKQEDWVLANGSLKGWAGRLWDFTQPGQWLGSSGGAGLGYGLGASLGAALAFRNSGKVVVDLQADGDFLFTPSALWTAAHHQLPVLVVMDNNRTYFNSENHQRLVAERRGRPTGNARVGTWLDSPPVDYAALARSFGLYGEGPISDPAEVRPALERALRIVKQERRLALVDVVTSAG